MISDDGKSVLATLKAGSYFGEISILNMGKLINQFDVKKMCIELIHFVT